MKKLRLFKLTQKLDKQKFIIYLLSNGEAWERVKYKKIKGDWHSLGQWWNGKVPIEEALEVFLRTFVSNGWKVKDYRELSCPQVSPNLQE